MSLSPDSSAINARANSTPSDEDKKAPDATCSSTTVEWLWWALAAWGVIFAGYIFLFFFSRPVSRWKSIEDFSGRSHAILMGIHWAGGVIILVAGPLQFVPWIRRTYPDIHRWTGRVYLAACALTAVPGLVYTALYSTIGGIPMDISFVGYGLAMLLCAGMTGWYAWQRELDTHRAWATRLYAIGIGSAVYRLLVFPLFLRLNFLDDREFKLWLNVAAWLFYLPELALAEAYIQGWCPGCCGTWEGAKREKPGLAGAEGGGKQSALDAKLVGDRMDEQPAGGLSAAVGPVAPQAGGGITGLAGSAGRAAGAADAEKAESGAAGARAAAPRALHAGSSNAADST